MRTVLWLCLLILLDPSQSLADEMCAAAEREVTVARSADFDCKKDFDCIRIASICELSYNPCGDHIIANKAEGVQLKKAVKQLEECKQRDPAHFAKREECRQEAMRTNCFIPPARCVNKLCVGQPKP